MKRVFMFPGQGSQYIGMGKEFYDTMLPLMKENLSRVYEDVAWFIEKYDYKNRDADWKNSKDAIQRGMQKLRGSDPSLAPHVLKK